MAVVLILGIFVGDAFGHLLPLWTGLMLAGGLLVLYLLEVAFLHGKGRFWYLFRSILLHGVCFALGFYLVSRDKQAQHYVFPTERVAFEAVVVSEPVVRGKVVQCELMALIRDKKPFRLRASILRDTIQNRYQRLHFGDGIRVLAAISRPEVVSQPSGQGNFDFLRWLQVHNVVGQTFIYHKNWQKAAVSMSSLSVAERAKIRLMRFRQKAVETLRQSGLDGEQQAVVAAMVLGDKSALTRELRETYSVSGASHVLALSGLHLGIIYFLLSFVFVKMGWRILGQIFTLPVIWIFALMVGFSPSVVRAATMLTVYGVVALMQRRSFSLNTLSLAAILMLAARPLALWDVGFQLSFMAVLGIILFYSPFNKALEAVFGKIMTKKMRRSKIFYQIFTWILGLSAVSMATQMTTAPLVAYYFGRFPVYFLATNFVAIPLVTMILYVAVTFFLTVAVESLLGASLTVVKNLLASALYGLSSSLNKSLETIASWPGSSIENIRLSSLQTLLLYVLITTISVMLTILWRNLRRHRLMKTSNSF